MSDVDKFDRFLTDLVSQQLFPADELFQKIILPTASPEAQSNVVLLRSTCSDNPASSLTGLRENQTSMSAFAESKQAASLDTAQNDAKRVLLVTVVRYARSLYMDRYIVTERSNITTPEPLRAEEHAKLTNSIEKALLFRVTRLLQTTTDCVEEWQVDGAHQFKFKLQADIDKKALDDAIQATREEMQ